jgi:hypothetical protein
MKKLFVPLILLVSLASTSGLFSYNLMGLLITKASKKNQSQLQFNVKLTCSNPSTSESKQIERSALESIDIDEECGEGFHAVGIGVQIYANAADQKAGKLAGGVLLS